MWPDLLADPKVLTVILTAFGGAIAWLWGKVSAAHKKHRDCEIQLAILKRDMAQAQGSIATLTKLLKKETHVG